MPGSGTYPGFHPNALALQAASRKVRGQAKFAPGYEPNKPLYISSKNHLDKATYYN